MFRLLALLLLVVLIALQVKLWSGEGSWTSEQELQQTVAEQRAENVRLKERNAALAAEVQDLKSGEAAVEERARAELGMVKPGEVFYRVVEPADPATQAAPEDVPEDSVPDNAPATATQSPPAAIKPPAAATKAPTQDAKH
jgi:cell division protein FtsB